MVHTEHYAWTSELASAMRARSGCRDPQLGAAHNSSKMLLHSLKDKPQLQKFMQHVAFEVRLFVVQHLLILSNMFQAATGPIAHAGLHTAMSNVTTCGMGLMCIVKTHAHTRIWALGCAGCAAAGSTACHAAHQVDGG